MNKCRDLQNSIFEYTNRNGRTIMTDKQPMDLSFFGAIVRDWRERKGFKTVSSLETEENRDNMLGKLMLVVTEVAEAGEAVRHNDIANFKEEIADTFIRLFDITGTFDIDIESEIIKKMAYNETRPDKHGKACSL
jgi:NTP pyrophosphatase (non-canonical NTP hydrolase)